MVNNLQQNRRQYYGMRRDTKIIVTPFSKRSSRKELSLQIINSSKVEIIVCFIYEVTAKEFFGLPSKSHESLIFSCTHSTLNLKLILIYANMILVLFYQRLFKFRLSIPFLYPWYFKHQIEIIIAFYLMKTLKAWAW